MTPEPSVLDLFGTVQHGPARRFLQAGPLSAVLEAGNLRDIRFGGVEVLRGISYLVRDSGWGTLAARIEAMEVREAPDRFDVTYRAIITGPEGHLTYDIVIEGRADGMLSVKARALALTDFLTNRTGFVLLAMSGAMPGASVARVSATLPAKFFQRQPSPLRSDPQHFLVPGTCRDVRKARTVQQFANRARVTGDG